jgi:lysophospholipase
MADAASSVPALEPRFLQPEGWRWHMFTNPDGRRLRFGTVSPKNRVPDAVVICLPGLSEFAEKYYETAHDMLSRNLAFWILDWQGQGKSDRPLANRQKRHSSSFDDDIDDLHFFLMEYVKHASVHPDVGRIPMVMLAHSMGANIGMRYLARNQDMFSCAAFTAPLMGIRATRFLPMSVALDISGVLKELMNLSYIPGGGDWTAAERDNPARNIFSSDPVRNKVHNAWLQADPSLQVGGITFGWLHEALRSCATLQNPDIMKRIGIPCLFALAGNERLVNNAVTRKLTAFIPNARVLELPGSLHEILMERDDIRSVFLQSFEDLLKSNNIKEKLRTF